MTQFTYFQQAGGQSLASPAVEITYGLERIVMALQGVAHFKDIAYNAGVTYGELFLQVGRMRRWHTAHGLQPMQRGTFPLQQFDTVGPETSLPALHMCQPTHVFRAPQGVESHLHIHRPPNRGRICVMSALVV